MRIAMVGHKRVPSREGGIEIVVEEIGARMAAQGHEVTCYNRGGHHVSGKEYEVSSKKQKSYRGMCLRTVPTIDKKGLAAITASFFGAVCAGLGKYDVVHFHAEGPCMMLWIPKLLGKRCVATIHGLDHQRGKWGKLARFTIMTGEKCAAKYADEIIVLSRGVQKYFKDTYDRETKLIPNGVNRPACVQTKEITDKYGLHKDEYILFLGRIVPEKGLTYLVEAYRQVKTDKKLVIAGGSSDTGGFYEQIKQQAEGDDRILFTGFVQGQMLEELYSNAYVYVLPSDLEGMPLSLLEAMSYGNCCLTSDIRECADVVEEHAVVFRHSDVGDLQSKLHSLCDDEELVKRYKAEAAEYICGKYNWVEVVKETLRVYVE